MKKKDKYIRYTYTYTDKSYSINQAYTQNHWIRRKRKEELKTIINTIIDNSINPNQTLTKFRLKIIFRNRLDCTNNAALEKIFTDCLRYSNIITDDNTKYLDKVSFQFKPGLDPNTVIFILKESK